MAKIKNDPFEILQQAHISKTMLSEKAVMSLALFDKAKALYEKRPASKEFQESTEKAGKITCDLMLKEIARIQKETVNEIEEGNKKESKRVHSKKIVEKSDVSFTDLELCRKKLKEDRKKRMEAGEIKPPKKKTLMSKLRIELVKTADLIPKNLKEDSSVIQRTNKAVLRFLNELKAIWGLNKIKPLEDELKEKFQKLEDKAA